MDITYENSPASSLMLRKAHPLRSSKVLHIVYGVNGLHNLLFHFSKYSFYGKPAAATNFLTGFWFQACLPTAVSLERKSVVRISRFLLGSFRRSHGDFTLRNFDGCRAYPRYDNLSKIHPSLPKSCIASLFYRIFSGSIRRMP